MLKKIFFVFALLFEITFTDAQNAWTNYKTSNSPLPENSVRCIAIDHLGRKWIGTDYGLAVFDNTNWTIYLQSNSGLPDNGVRAITFDTTGAAWIGTFNGGLAKFDGAIWTTFDISNSSLPDNFVKALTFDTVGALWIGTVSGIARFDGSTWQTFTTTNSVLISANITAILVMPDNRKIMGTLNGGLVIFVDDTIQSILTIANGSGIPDNTQLGLDKDSLGNVWLATAANGVAAYRGTLGWFWYYLGNSQIATNSLTCLKFALDESKLWMGSVDSGLIKKTGIFFRSYTTQNSGMPDNYVQCIAVDDSGVVWMGTASTGVVRFDESLLSGVNEMALQQNSVSVFPNPFTDALTVSVPIAMGIQFPTVVKMFDVFGKEILSQNVSTSNNIPIAIGIQTSTLPKGIYFVKIIWDNNKVILQKVVKD